MAGDRVSQAEKWMSRSGDELRRLDQYQHAEDERYAPFFASGYLGLAPEFSDSTHRDLSFFRGVKSEDGLVVLYFDKDRRNSGKAMELAGWFARVADVVNSRVIGGEGDLIKPFAVVAATWQVRSYAGQAFSPDFLPDGIVTADPSIFKRRDGDQTVENIGAHEVIHVVARQRFGIQNVPGLCEAAAVCGAMELYPEGINYKDCVKSGLEEVLVSMAEDSGSLRSPTQMLEAAENMGRKGLERSYEYSYWYGVAFREGFFRYQMRIMDRSYEETKTMFWKLYKNCCGTVKDPESGKILAKNGIRQNQKIGSEEILKAGLLELDFYKQHPYKANELIDGVSKVMEEIARGECVPILK